LLPFIILVVGSCERFQDEQSKSRDKKSFRDFTFNEDGDTIITYYRPDGSLKSQITVKNKRKNGLAYNYYENGNIQNEIIYLDGYKDGIAKWYYQSGELYRETLYKNGQKSGIQKKYYENGALKAEIPYLLDEPVVGTKEYKKSGKLITEYPKIVVSPINRLDSESTYYIRLKLMPEKKNVNYYFSITNDGKEAKILLDEYTKNGVVNYPIKLPPGHSMDEILKIRAVIKTSRGNYKVLQTDYRLSIRNKS
jgi:hypothetical protein